jgi:hypothetical protein
MQGPGSRARLPLVAPSTQDSVPNLQAAHTVDVNHVDNNAAGGYGMFIDSNEQKELDQESWLEENNPHWGKSQACR